MHVRSVAFGTLSACVILAGTIAFSGCASSSQQRAAETSPGMFAGENVLSFKVEGMACRNCAKEIAHELEEVPGVRAAMIDFDSATAKVAVDPDPAKAPSLEALHAAVEQWRREHFSLPDDPNCLDPARRAELQRESGQ